MTSRALLTCKLQLLAIERIDEYVTEPSHLDLRSTDTFDSLLSTPQEPPAVIDNKRPPAHWPASGEIFIDNLAVRYAPHLPLALKDVSVTISPGQKVGIVGRTGSGKTSRLPEL